MAPFRARVLLLSLGMIMMICIQIYRTHFDVAPILIDSQEDIDVISKRELSVKRHPLAKSKFNRHNEKPLEALEPTVKSADFSSSEDSQVSSRHSLGKENSEKEEYPIQPVKKLQHTSHDSSIQHSSKDVQKFEKSRHAVQETLLDYSKFSNNSLLRKTIQTGSGAHKPPLQEYPEKQHRLGPEHTRAATISSSWFATGELGSDYDYYNISWRRLIPISDNITIDISRYMNGRPVYRAPVIAHDPSLCDVGGAGLFLLVIIPSLPRHHEMRAVIRETWASPVYNGGFWAGRKLNESVRLTFIFGATNYTYDDKAILRAEMKNFGDILVMDFVDSYQNLSTKMANSLYWAGKYCQGVRHLFKVDEDTYVHLPQLINIIKRVEKKTDRFMLGHQHNHHYPKVVRKGKWRVGLEYPLPYYPRYIYGHSYVVSGAALPDILRALRTTPGIKNEDAFITGIVAKLTDIPRFHTRAFAGTSYQQVLCNITRGYYVSLTFCCKEHLRMLYKHAVEGRCDTSRFHQIPSWKCRFFKHGDSHQPHNGLEGKSHADRERKKHLQAPVRMNKFELERLFNVGAGLIIEEMGKQYFKENEEESDEDKDMNNLSAEEEDKIIQTEIETLSRGKGKHIQETFKVRE